MEVMLAEPPENGPRMMNTKLAALYVGLAESTLEKKRLYGDGPPFIKLTPTKGGAVRYLRDDLEKWLKSLRASSTSEVDFSIARYSWIRQYTPPARPK
jgi:hypothetical protein